MKGHVCCDERFTSIIKKKKKDNIVLQHPMPTEKCPYPKGTSGWTFAEGIWSVKNPGQEPHSGQFPQCSAPSGILSQHPTGRPVTP